MKGDEYGNILYCRGPNRLDIHTKVVMNQLISHTGNVLPRNSRISALGSNLKALRIMMPELKDVKAYDILGDAANRYAEEMRKET